MTTSVKTAYDIYWYKNQFFLDHLASLLEAYSVPIFNHLFYLIPPPDENEALQGFGFQHYLLNDKQQLISHPHIHLLATQSNIVIEFSNAELPVVFQPRIDLSLKSRALIKEMEDTYFLNLR